MIFGYARVSPLAQDLASQVAPQSAFLARVRRVGAFVKVAHRRGVNFGRKPKLTPDRLGHVRKMIEQGKTPSEAA